MIIGQGIRLALAGLLLGLGGALSLTRVMLTLLFGISATDPPTFAVITLLLMAVALVARRDAAHEEGDTEERQRNTAESRRVGWRHAK
jgi:putative ABC transport system permease protein